MYHREQRSKFGGTVKNRGRLVSSLLILVALVAGVVFITASGGDDGPSESDSTFLARVGSVGPDAFSSSFATAAAEGPFRIQTGEIDSNSDNLYVVPGRTYGGSGANMCDIDGMKEFFNRHPDRARAWARTQQIGMSEIPAFLDSLTPMILAQNVKVTMFGFRGGNAYGYPAVIEAGTAVLVDADGMPRARCACGNPLIASKDPVKTAKAENERLSEELTQAVTDSATDTTLASDTTTAVETTAATETTITTDTTIVTETTVVTDTAVDATTTTSPGTTVLECPPEDSVKYGDIVADGNGELWIREDTAYWPLGRPQKPVGSLAELPGYQDGCVPCIDVNVGRDGVVYIAPDGTRWTSEYSAAGTIYWRSDSAALTTAELMKNNPECNPCPPINAVTGATYADKDGTIWELKEGRWVNQATGTSVSYVTDIPGYTDACDPCVNESATYQRDAAGLPVTATVPEDSPASQGTVVINPAGAAAPTELTDDRVAEWTATSDDCTLPCPPLTTATGDRYVDSNGQLWTYTDSMWTNTVNGTRRTYLRDLPGWSNNCNPCPPKEGAAEGSTYVDSDGKLWTFTDGRWTNEAGESRTYASDLNGWDENCNLPPCPPLTPGQSGTQLKDADGTVWTYEHGGWTSSSGARRYNLRDFPGCDPCPPTDRTQWTDGMVYIAPDGLPWFYENGGWSGPRNSRVYELAQLPGCGDTPAPAPGDDGSTSGDASASGTTDTTEAPAVTVAPTTTVAAATTVVDTTSAPATTTAPTTAPVAATTTVAPATATTVASATTVKAPTTTAKPAATTTAVNKAPTVKVTACSGLGENQPVLTLTASDSDGGINVSGFAAFASSPDGSETRNTPASSFAAVAGQANKYTVALGVPAGGWLELVGTVTARDTKGLGTTVAFQVSATPKSGYLTCP